MSILQEMSRELLAMVALATPAVVSVEHRRGQGSGVVIAPDGYVLTNAHVVGRPRGERGAPRLRTGFAGGGHAAASLVGADARTDLAVLRADASGLSALPMAAERSARVGELVLAIGNPLRLDRSVSLGVVSATDRVLPTRGGMLEGLVQTDAAINPGNSGGPLLDAAGAVLGVNTAIVPYAQGIGFAVSARTASWVAAVLIRSGEVRRPAIGITASGLELPVPLAREAGQVRAVRVFRVHPDTPAASSGLRAEDLLLTANGDPLASVDDLLRALVLAGGREVSLRLLRGREARALELGLAIGESTAAAA